MECTPRMLQKLMEKEDCSSELAGSDVLAASTPSSEVTNSRVVMGEGVDEGHSLNATPPSISEAGLFRHVLSL